MYSMHILVERGYFIFNLILKKKKKTKRTQFIVLKDMYYFILRTVQYLVIFFFIGKISTCKTQAWYANISTT